MEYSKNSESSIIKQTKNYIIRLIEPSDYEKGFFELLQQLTTAPKLSKEKYLEILELNKNNKIIIIEDKIEKNKLIGTVKIYFDYKFARGGKKVGHLEDIVIDENYREKGFGSILVNVIIDLAKSEGCYKLILNSGEEYSGFYEKNGFKKAGLYFRISF